MTLAEGSRIDFFEGACSERCRLVQYKPDLAGPPLPDRARLQPRSPKTRARAVARSTPRRKSGGRNNARPHDDAPSRRRPQAPLPRRSTSGATRTACRRRVARSSTIRTARRASRCCTTPTARSATSSRPSACAVGDRVETGPRRRHQAGQRLPLANIPLGTIVHNVELRPGRGGAARAQRRRGDPADGEGRRLRAAQAALRRAAPGAASRAAPPIGQVGNLDHENISIGKAGPHALARAAPAACAAWP